MRIYCLFGCVSIHIHTHTHTLKVNGIATLYVIWLWIYVNASCGYGGHYGAYLFVHELPVLKMGFEICNGFGSVNDDGDDDNADENRKLNVSRRRIICSELLWEIFFRYNVDDDDDNHETKSEHFFFHSLRLSILFVRARATNWSRINWCTSRVKHLSIRLMLCGWESS